MQSPTVHISLLGVVRARTPGGEVILHGAQPRVVLTYLALHGEHPVASDDLAMLLWPGRRAPHWEGAVRGLITKVRSFLSELGPDAPAISNVGHTTVYRLITTDTTTIDVWQAELDLAAALKLMAAGRADLAAEKATRAAIALTDRLLPGHEDDWIERWRTQLAATRLHALRLASAAQTASDNHPTAVLLAESAIEEDRYDEESHRLVMTAHLAAGNRAAALRAYGQCRRNLADDLGISPSDETEALYLRLLTPGPFTIAPLTQPSRRLLPMLIDRPFVGRGEQLEALCSVWELAQRGQLQIVVLHGEAGIGKTRTGLEAVRRMSPENVLYGRSSAEKIIPFEPFAEAIGAFADRLGDDELRDLTRGFGWEVAALVPSLSARLPHDRRAGDLNGNQPRLFEAVRLVLGRAASRPTVLAIDDLHLADPSTLLMLRHCARMLHSTRLLIVITYRDDYPGNTAMSEALAELSCMDECHTGHLEGLSPHDVADLLRLTSVPEADRLGQALHDRTGGNSFYVTQVLAAASDAPGPFDPMLVPGTVSDVVRHRMATLSPPAQQVLATAAAIGVRVPLSYLSSAIDHAGGSVEAVDELIERRFLLQDERGDLGFVHAVVRDAVYSHLPGSLRSRLHVAIAAAIQSGTITDGQSTVLLSYHLDLAGRRSSSAEDGDVDPVQIDHVADEDRLALLIRQ